MSGYLYVKALHIVSVVSWFAGLLYIVRLFIYHVESAARPQAERAVLHAQFSIMERRLWFGITWPAAVATAVFGVWLMILTQAYTQPWFHLKLALLALLIAYHLRCGRIRKALARGEFRVTSKHLRVWNELATLLLFAIVFTAELKNPMSAAKAMLWVVVVAAVGVGVMVVRRRGKKVGGRESGDGS